MADPTYTDFLRLIRELLGEQLAEDFWKTQMVVFENAKQLRAGVPFTELTERSETILYHCWPGVGKTQATVNIAESFIPELPTLVSGLSHKSFDNVKTKSRWAHWRGHDKGCQASILWTKGYEANSFDCTCEVQRTNRTGGPTFAPLDYVLSTTQFGPPLSWNIHDYFLWVIDEIDYSRFVGTMTFEKKDLERWELDHDSQVIRELSGALRRVHKQHSEVHKDAKQYSQFHYWYGGELFGRIDETLLERGGSLKEMIASLEGLAEADLPRVTSDHLFEGVEGLPVNFAPHLFKRFIWEAKASRVKLPMNPLIHLVWDRPTEHAPRQSLYRLRWRRWLVRHLSQIIVLDASADMELLKRVFGPVNVKTASRLPFPTEVRVKQLVGKRKRVGKGTLGSISDGGESKLTAGYRALIQAEVKAIGITRDDGRQKKIGVITFQNLLLDSTKSLREMGVAQKDIVEGYYFNLRGENFFNDCDLLLVIGFPNPNPHGLFEEASALMGEEWKPLDRTPILLTARLKMRNGNSVTVRKIGGYKDDRLQRLKDQKSKFELYQAFHRSRAYLRPLDGQSVDILVFTDIPIPEVEVDGFMGFEGLLFSALEARLTDQDVVTIRQVVSDLLASTGEDDSTTSRDRWRTRINTAVEQMDRDAGWLCEATGTSYVAGTSKGNPGRFVRNESA